MLSAGYQAAKEAAENNAMLCIDPNKAETNMWTSGSSLTGKDYKEMKLKFIHCVDDDPTVTQGLQCYDKSEITTLVAEGGLEIDYFTSDVKINFSEQDDFYR